MNCIIGLLCVTLVAGCGQRARDYYQQGPSPLLDVHSFTKDASEQLTVDAPIRDVGGFDIKKLDLVLSGNALHARLNSEDVWIVDLPRLIKAPLKLRYFERVAMVPNLDSLVATCESMNYKTMRRPLITAVRAKAYLNPFMSVDFHLALMRAGASPFYKTISGSIDAVSVRTEIVAPFLEAAEIERLVGWMGKHFDSEKKAIGFTAVGYIDERLRSRDPVAELGRLICGILAGEAYIDFVLTAKDGRSLTARVDRVEFSHY
ncbi:MAG TPA: hypothetical protein VEL47_07560 [Myxococcota bacterium]|nr:hypothetical protein [Myxococcota bacterium]